MKEQRKYLTEEELKRFLKGIESTRDRAIFTVSYWRGLRAEEPGQLKLSDWDRKAGRRIFATRIATLTSAVARRPLCMIA
jgi:integrase